MDKKFETKVRSGWCIIDKLTGRLFKQWDGSNSEEPYFAKTRKDAIAFAKHIGKGRKSTVVRVSVTYDFYSRGAAEVTGEDARNF